MLAWKMKSQCGNSPAVQSMRRREKVLSPLFHCLFLRHLSVVNIVSLFILPISVAFIHDCFERLPAHASHLLTLCSTQTVVQFCTHSLFSVFEYVFLVN